MPARSPSRVIDLGGFQVPAEALGRLADSASMDAIRKLAADYPEVSTRKVLLATCTGKR
ncbi:MAG: hypothetical protein NTY65_10055 [Planctomycetota bacterium]|nr:hypothetical protein [Planctomycetota bacterium]